jgi:recombination protein RecA
MVLYCYTTWVVKMDIEEILAKLDKKTRSRVMAAQEISLERLPVASLGLTKALNGGFGYGRQSVIYGNKSAGKSSICLQMIADAQKEGRTCAWIDSEGTYDPIWANRLGVDNSQLIVAPSKSIEEFTAVGCDLMSAGVDILVADSISAMLPSTYFEKEDELKQGLEGTKQIGQSSKELGIAVNKFNAVNKKTALILISQVRNQFNTYGASQKPMGGFAMMFFSTTVVKLWSSASEREQLTGDVVMGDKIVSQPIGRPVTWTVEYNKIGAPNKIGSYDFYYSGDDVGVDLVGEIVDIAEQHGIITKAGGWYTFEDQKYQGKKLIAWLKSNPDKTEQLYRKVLNA